MSRGMKHASFLLILPMLAACTVGPDYVRPAAPAAPFFKEGIGWHPADPQDAMPRGAWWRIYRDPTLDKLESRVVVSNQNVAQAAANWRAAVALIKVAQAAALPSLSVGPGASLAQGGSGGSGNGGVRTNYSLEASASWDLDVWGRIRREVEASRAAAAISEADLAAATLSAQSALATAYFELRGSDAQIALLNRTVIAYQRSLTITQNQYRAGTVAQSDVAAAETQLATARASAIALGVARAQYEHAIAVLAGLPPAELSLPAGPLARDVPVVPAGVPSDLLQRRPDIAAAERLMAEQNANIGVAIAAYYPDVTLSALFGYAGNPLGSLISTANRVWSLGAAASETVFEGGARAGNVAAARADYDAAVAAYRQTVLNAFQQTEDALSTLRIEQNQAAAQAVAVSAAERTLTIVLNEYRAGTVAYTAVVVAQAEALSSEESAVLLRQDRLVQSVALIAALGGGWQAPPP